jgi:hypothetical protein
MTTDSSDTRSAFQWNAGGWLGTQIGCTLWLLILGAVLMARDPLAGGLCIGAFAVLNGWGLYLWRSRDRLSAYAGLQRFLMLASVLVAGVVIAVNWRGLSELPGPGMPVSTYLPYWVIPAFPALMLYFYWRERQARRGGR